MLGILRFDLEHHHRTGKGDDEGLEGEIVIMARKVSVAFFALDLLAGYRQGFHFLRPATGEFVLRIIGAITAVIKIIRRASLLLGLLLLSPWPRKLDLVTHYPEFVDYPGKVTGPFSVVS